MKILASLSGAVASGLVCFVIFSLISKYQIAQVGYTPNQSDKLIDIFICRHAIGYSLWRMVIIENKRHLTW